MAARLDSEGDDQGEGAGDFDRAGKVPKPVADAGCGEHLNHLPPSGELGAARACKRQSQSGDDRPAGPFSHSAHIGPLSTPPVICGA